ncbi:MAG: MBG domain-containing protein [Eubacteriales bacterium]|nr:MBG domain-containing protein [Eubacteriales bacterium]
MKLKGKALLSLLIVLTLLVQLFTVSAAATYGESLALAVSATDGAEFGSEFITAGSSMAALMSDGLSIVPPSGYCVQSAWIEGGDGANGTMLPLSADPNGSTSVGMSGEAFVDHSGYEPVFNDALLASLGGAYTLHVLLAPVDPAVPVEISDAWGNVSTGSVTLPGNPGGEGFVGWRLDYGSNITALVQPGMTVYPYANCRYEAAYATVVTAQPQAMSINAGDPVGYVQVDFLNLPYNMQVVGGDGYCQDGDYPAADSVLCVNPGAYLAYSDGSAVPADVAMLVTGTAPLTVIAAPVHTHTPGEAVHENEIPASCAQGGSYDAVVRCVECGEELSRETVYTDPLSHTPGEAQRENEVPASCAQGGSYDAVVRCIYCNTELSRETVTTDPVPHTPGEAVIENNVPATCTEQGHYDSVVYCTVCGTELSRETVTAEATGHTAGEAVVENNVPATCTEQGHYDSVVYCTVCGTELSRETVTAEATGHTAGEAVVENEIAATCAQGGSYDAVVRCTVCGAELSRETVTTDPVPHTPGEAVRENEVPATCEAGGSYDEVVRCTVCEAEISRETVTSEALGHNWGEWAVTKEATETEEGVETRVCQNDANHTETRPIPKKSHTHTLTKVEAVPATCEADGTEAYWTCSGCGKLYSDEAGTQEIEAPVAVPATGHDWGEWAVTKEATETEEGVETRVCRNDESHVETKAIPAIGHTHSLTKVEAVPATCEAGGTEAYWTCSGCNKLFSDEAGTQEIEAPVAVPATGHDWGEWAVTKEATEAEEGIETRTCRNDETHTETRPIPKKGHTHSLTKIPATAATYEKDGNIEYYSCSGCGKLYADANAAQEITLEQTVIPKLAVKAVTVTVADQSWIVGSGTVLDQTRYTVTGFEPGDQYTVTLSATGYTGLAGTYEITAALSGYDTAKYHVTVIPGKLTVSSPIVYRFMDGQNGYQWTQASGTSLVLKVDADIRKFVGVKVDGVQLPENCYIVSSGSTVVTLLPEYLKNLTPANHAISIEFTDGSAATTFVVNQAPVSTPISIKGYNVSMPYNGNAYNLSNYAQNTRGVTFQFHLEQNGQTVAQAINPGTYEIYLDSLSFSNAPANGYRVTILDSSGQVVSTDYKNGRAHFGTLTITGSNVTNVTVTVNDQAWTYDGTAHTPNASGYTVSGLQGNDTLTVKLSVVDAGGRTLSAVTDAGTYTIKADCTGYDSSRYNVTVVKSGTLTVSPYKLTLTAESAVKNYDGSPLRNSNVKATALLSGHRFRANDGVKFSVYDSRGNLIQNGPVAVGTYTKKVTDVHIVDSNGIEVTSNYDITRIDGTLTINNSDGSPKTGDTNKLTLWIVLLAVSALLILAVATLFLRRGRKGKAGKKQAPKADARPADKK